MCIFYRWQFIVYLSKYLFYYSQGGFGDRSWAPSRKMGFLLLAAPRPPTLSSTGRAAGRLELPHPQVRGVGPVLGGSTHTGKQESACYFVGFQLQERGPRKGWPGFTLNLSPRLRIRSGSLPKGLGSGEGREWGVQRERRNSFPNASKRAKVPVLRMEAITQRERAFASLSPPL